MPTYQFVCNDCAGDYEIFLMRMLRDADRVCPSCGSTNVRQAYRDFFGYTASRSSGGGAAGHSGGGCGTGGFR
ncbi:MAG: zinc ribbon domain-containing protein [Actinobacteria bacterium]|nr:zinc ribbon domain-containing protein [Actinomycetota bacterium]